MKYIKSKLAKRPLNFSMTQGKEKFNRLLKSSESNENGCAEIQVFEDKHFIIKGKNWQLTEEWKKTHGCNHDYCGAIVGKFSYTFVPTSIGTICTCKCTCGKEYIVQGL